MEVLLTELLKHQWSKDTREIWADADFKCAYCGLNLLASHDNYRQGEIEHLLPQCVYGDDFLAKVWR